MTVNELIVSMVQGAELKQMWGARGKALGAFLGFNLKLNTRTFHAAKVHRLIKVAKDTKPHADDRGRVIVWQLTESGAQKAELLMMANHDMGDCHVFTHLVPGVAIQYGPCKGFEGVWYATVGDRVIEFASELEFLVRLVRQNGHVSANCHICGCFVTSLADDPNGGLSRCGDCNQPTCGAHRVEGAAERCTKCADLAMEVR